jgi:predicted DNA-binding protein (MmcQ/YjbR family)
MTQREILDVCLALPGAYLDYPFGPDSAVCKVKAPSMEKGRIFAIAFALRGEPLMSFNCDRPTGEFYRQVYPGGVTRGWHCPPVQQPYVNTVKLDGTVPDGELLRMIDHAYWTVRGKLPKKAQKEMEETE